MPKDQEDDIKADGIGKGDVDTNVPWTSHDSIRHRDAKASPNPTRPVASGEDMSVRLQHTRTVSAQRFIQGTYIPVVEVRASVKAPPAQQPGEKLDFCGESGCPEQRRVRRKSLPVHGTVGAA